MNSPDVRLSLGSGKRFFGVEAAFNVFVVIGVPPRFENTFCVPDTIEALVLSD
jgi:hypothetical protein